MDDFFWTMLSSGLFLFGVYLVISKTIVPTISRWFTSGGIDRRGSAGDPLPEIAIWTFGYDGAAADYQFADTGQAKVAARMLYMSRKGKRYSDADFSHSSTARTYIVTIYYSMEGVQT
jgi:hypothetical protein